MAQSRNGEIASFAPFSKGGNVEIPLAPISDHKLIVSMRISIGRYEPAVYWGRPHG